MKNSTVKLELVTESERYFIYGICVDMIVLKIRKITLHLKEIQLKNVEFK